MNTSEMTSLEMTSVFVASLESLISKRGVYVIAHPLNIQPSKVASLLFNFVSRQSLKNYTLITSRECVRIPESDSHTYVFDYLPSILELIPKEHLTELYKTNTLVFLTTFGTSIQHLHRLRNLFPETLMLNTSFLSFPGVATPFRFELSLEPIRSEYKEESLIPLIDTLLLHPEDKHLIFTRTQDIHEITQKIRENKIPVSCVSSKGIIPSFREGVLVCSKITFNSIPENVSYLHICDSFQYSIQLMRIVGGGAYKPVKVKFYVKANEADTYKALEAKLTELLTTYREMWKSSSIVVKGNSLIVI